MKLTKFDSIRWQETPRMRWRLVGVKPFFTDFAQGVFAWFLLFGAVGAILGFLARSSLSHTERWLSFAVPGGMGAATMLMVGWLPSTVRLSIAGLYYKSILRGGRYHFSECSRIRCEPYKSMLKLSLDMSPAAGWYPQTIVFAAPVKRLDDILFLLNASGKFEDSAGLQTDIIPARTEEA